MTLSGDKKYTRGTFKTGYKFFLSCALNFHLSLGTPYLFVFLLASLGTVAVYIKLI